MHTHVHAPSSTSVLPRESSSVGRRSANSLSLRTSLSLLGFPSVQFIRTSFLAAFLLALTRRGSSRVAVFNGSDVILASLLFVRERALVDMARLGGRLHLTASAVLRRGRSLSAIEAAGVKPLRRRLHLEDAGEKMSDAANRAAGWLRAPCSIPSRPQCFTTAFLFTPPYSLLLDLCFVCFVESGCCDLVCVPIGVCCCYCCLRIYNELGCLALLPLMLRGAASSSPV